MQEVESKTKDAGISILIPAFNEEKTIGLLLECIVKQADNLNAEIIVINDGSTDRTLNNLQRFSDKITLINLEKNRGKGAAVREGLKMARGKIVIIQDADLELNPEDYPRLIEPIIQGRAQVVYGSRALGTNTKRIWPFYVGGRVLTILANLLYGVGISDQNTCYKVMKTNLLREMNLESKGFELCSEMTAKIGKRKIKIHEVSISYNPRTKKEGKKIKILDGLKAMWTLIKYKIT